MVFLPLNSNAPQAPPSPPSPPCRRAPWAIASLSMPQGHLDPDLDLDPTWYWNTLLNCLMSCSPGRRWKVALDAKAPQGCGVRSRTVTNWEERWPPGRGGAGAEKCMGFRETWQAGKQPGQGRGAKHTLVQTQAHGLQGN